MSDEDLHARLLAFISSAFAREGHESCIRIGLYYTPGGVYKKDELEMWRADSPRDAHLFDKDQRNHIYVEKLVTDILDKAIHHASTFFGAEKHAFSVHAFKAMNGYNPHRFVISPEYKGGGSEELATGNEGGGVAGSSSNHIIAMLMKHIESNNRGSLQKDQAIFGAMGHQLQQALAENTELRKQISDLLKERTEYMGLIESAKSEEHKRQIEAHLVTAAEERKTAVTKDIMRLAPVALSQWMGSGKGKGKNGSAGTSGKPPSPLAVVVGKLLGSLTGDQSVEIEEMLSIRERVMLGEAMTIVENGDSELLPMIVHNLVTSLTTDGAERVGRLMELMRPEQRVLFIEAITLAQAKAEPPAKPEDAGEVNAPPHNDQPAS
jgi:hypothetical protein